MSAFLVPGGLSGGLPAGLPAAPSAPVLRRAIVPNARLLARHDLTPSVARFVVTPDGGVPPFKPGQYFALGLTVDGVLLQRPYSTASPEGSKGELEFLVRRVEAGTFTPRLWETAPGSRVWLGPPRGLFTLRPGDERSHIFVSAGTGLAPFISMAASLLDRASVTPRVAVLHGVSYQSELAYRDRLEAWQASGRMLYAPTISRPNDPANAGWTGRTGRVDSILARVLEEAHLSPDGSVAYLCGNPDMIEAASAVLDGLGFPKDAVVSENYWTLPG